jgi:ABC-type nitrate/sulfonate/bicarbonate transport system substrate-binding protein
LKRTHAHIAPLFVALSLLLAACGGAAGAPSAAPASSSAASAEPASSVPASAKPAASAAAGAKPAASGAGANTKPAASGSAAAKPVASEIVISKPAAGGTKITMCIPSRSNPTLPAFAAVDGGLVSQAGIEASMPYFAGGAVDQALAAGQCDFVYGAGGVGPLLQGVDVTMVAVTLNKSQFEVWGKPPLKTLADLKGHTVGTTGAGSLSWRVGRFYLRSNGIDPDKDASVLATGDNTSTLAAAVSGRVDSAVLTFPLTGEAQRQGLNLLYKAPDDFEFISQGVATTKRYETAHRDVVKAVVKAVADSMAHLKSDSAFYTAELKKYTNLNLDDATFQQYWKTDGASYAIPPRGSHKGAVAALSLYADDANIKANVDSIADRWIDTSIVDELFPPK